VSKQDYNITRLYEPDLTLFDWSKGQRVPARRSDPETSIRSAEAIMPRVAGLKAMILETLKQYGPQTIEELHIRLGRKEVSVSPRMIELEKAGQVRRNGTRHNPTSGQEAIAWEAI